MTSKKIFLLEGLELMNAFITYFKPWALTPSPIQVPFKIITLQYQNHIKR